MAQNKMSSQQLSLKINEVLDHVCVNNEIIRCRRNCYLQLECNRKVKYYTKHGVLYDCFYFGSQSEGTTTTGIHSDFDYVNIDNNIVVVTNDSDYVSENTYTFKMDKFTNRGYCCIRDTSICKDSDMSYGNFKKSLKKHYRPNTSYLMNSFYVKDNLFGENPEREGPALYIRSPNNDEFNFIDGFYCTTWPSEVINTFCLNQTKRLWPSDRLVEDILKSRCFVVPKGRDNGPDSDIEWRLSFSFGERILMFDLNIVQIRCYVLMKYIKITFLDNVPNCKGIVSSYVCKTVLFHYVSQTPNCEWVEEKLIQNFNKCLCELRKYIDEENCPHFIMPMNNLLANKLDKTMSARLSMKLKEIIESNDHALYGIELDDFGELLKDEDISGKEHAIRTQREQFFVLMTDNVGKELALDFYDINPNRPFMTSISQSNQTNTGREYKSSENIGNNNIEIRRKIKMRFYWLQQLRHNTSESDERMHAAIDFFECTYSTLIGSLLASTDIQDNRSLSSEALQRLQQGLKYSDAASAHLKLASVSLLSGDLDSTNSLLDIIRNILDGKHIVNVCSCRDKWVLTQKNIETGIPQLLKLSYLEMRKNAATCVTYLPEEIGSCPKELQYEMYRAVFAEKPEIAWSSIWIYLAQIPQLPFLYFLQYKLYKERGMTEQYLHAFGKLIGVLWNAELYSRHLDTILNLIGQCHEQEGQMDLALLSYYYSIQIEPVYNAAKFLICCNIVKQLRLQGRIL
ncbi:hypothetical protein ACF0H5_023160 [Mactra antiquata]